MSGEQKHKLKVADFFCGAGGFSEGFRQAGFEICFAIDKWTPAYNTYKSNLAHTKVIQDDVIWISNLPDKEFEDTVPDTEVIIGSPPCVAFSSSNKSGNGDKKLGIELLEAYLRIIARKKFKKESILKYWVLENVPNIEEHIKDVYTEKDLNLPGPIRLYPKKNSDVYNAKHFGAPTNRKRFICGEFPKPKKTKKEDDALTLGTVLDSLRPDEKGFVRDCNYRGFKMKYDDVSDHQYQYKLEEFEWKTAKRLKEDKGYMGKMSFPERLDKPSRTVMATMSSSSRESMILGVEGKKDEYRLPTVREVASMMSFPIDYRFYGNTKGTKYALVGNAVPPKFSLAIAKAILKKEGLKAPRRYTPIQYSNEFAFTNLNGKKIEEKKEKRKKSCAKFKYHIPYMIISSYRVELTNYESIFEMQIINWDAEIHYSQGKENAKKFMPNPIIEHLTSKHKTNVKKFIEKNTINTSRSEFQDRFCMTSEERGNLMGPYELLDNIKGFIEKEFTNDELSESVFFEEINRKVPNGILVGYYILSEILKGFDD